VILSLQDKRTTSEALRRNGVAYLASQGRLHRAWRRPADGGIVAGPSCQTSIARSASLSIFGGFAGHDPANSRMFVALRPLGASATPEEGDP